LNARDALSIVIPAFNEAERLPATLATLRAWADQRAAPVEVVVADDGSTDATAAVVAAVAAEDERVALVRLGGNRGKGAAVRHGVLRARHGWVLICDADLSTPIEDVDRLAAAAARAEAELAIGSRDVADSRIERHQPRYREAMGRTFNLLVRLAAVGGLRDTQCGFKLLRADAARALVDQLTIEGFAFDVELLYLARQAGYRVVEVGVRWSNDDRSRVDPLRDSLRMLADVVQVRLRHPPRRG
jgi:dolichyl-phosphate beta-glucosyltransferase